MSSPTQTGSFKSCQETQTDLPNESSAATHTSISHYTSGTQTTVVSQYMAAAQTMLHDMRAKTFLVSQRNYFMPPQHIPLSAIGSTNSYYAHLDFPMSIKTR